MSSPITLVTTIFLNADLLEQFLQHYRALGVGRFLLLINEYSAIQGVPVPTARDVEIMQIYSDNRGYGQALTGREHAAVQRRCQPDDLVIYADLDEFYEFPGELAVLADNIKARRCDYVRGKLLDRVTEDGSIPDGPPTFQMSRDFPMGCAITTGITEVNGEKIMLCRAGMSMGNGHHSFARGQEAQKPYDAEGVAHHYKWRGDLLVRTRNLLAAYTAAGMPQQHKIANLLNWLGSPPRIDLTDTRLRTRRIAP